MNVLHTATYLIRRGGIFYGSYMSAFDDIPESAYSEVINRLFGQYALVEHNDCFNFVCPVCGDMTRINKKKAYIYKDKWLYVCYKCGESRSFMGYLKENSPEDYSKLLFYAFRGKNNSSDNQPKRVENVKPSRLPFGKGELIPITDSHPLAKEGLALCKQRRIRPDVYEQWFVCPEDNEFLAKDLNGNYIINPNTGRPYGNEYRNRIIIPFYRFGGTWGQFDARAIDPNNTLRYLNYAGAKRTAYNIDFVNFKKPFYILEGTIDSTFIKNSIAIGGIAHLKEVIADNPDIMKYKENCTIIWDNDDPGRKAMVESTKMGFNWFDWDGLTEKDINGAVLHNQMPLNNRGFVDPEFIASRSRKPGTSGILFMVKYGNIAKDEFKKKMQAKRTAAANFGRAHRVDTMF